MILKVSLEKGLLLLGFLFIGMLGLFMLYFFIGGKFKGEGRYVIIVFSKG